MRVLGIDNVVMTVTDLAEARAFYGSILGLAEKFFFPDRGLIGYRIGEEEPGLLIRLDVSSPPVALRGPRVWLESDDARAAVGQLHARGVEPLAEPFRVRTGWAVEFADPFGNVVGLADYTAAPELGRAL